MEQLQKWAHVAEITGAIAVVLSLLYVGYQVKENTEAQQSETEMNLFTLGYELDSWYKDPDFVALVAQADSDYSALSLTGQLQYERYVLMQLNLWAYALKSFERGQIDAGEWQAWNNYFTVEIGRAGWRAAYDKWRDGYHPNFQQHVDSAIRAP